ncbi:MAG: class I SAM-dependent methyltransferase [Rhodocyclaceae bacterium]|jgi:SAM-dependent methyltransferase|nr:class I SAM-dependent methyltransferase [Rhodocyclaceae bacterium]
MAINGFAEWLRTPQGKYVLAWEQHKLDILVADIFGFNSVQIGFSQHDFLRANRMPFHVSCCDRGSVTVQSDPRYLPFATNSIDLIVLPHVLEFNPNPHQILREVERVLVPEGSAVVTGFNPYSLWGLRRAMARHTGRPPWQGRYLSVPRLRDWFTLLGFETRSGAFGCYVPPVRQEKWLKRWGFMDAAGDRWWPIAGGVYVVQAIKRQHGMRLITPKWHERMAAARALAAVARKPLAHKTREQ